MLISTGSGTVRYFTYEVGGAPAGEAQLHSDGMIWAVEVYEAYRGQGHGHSLMKALLDAVQWEFPTVRLLVRETNYRAVSFYEDLGFEVVHRSVRGFLMQKSLEE